MSFNGARAALLLPGQESTTTGAGTYGVAKIYDTGFVPFTGLNNAHAIVFTGLLDTQVWQEAGGTLDFVYQFSNDPTSGDGILRFSASGFAGLIPLNADDTAIAGGTIFPTTVDRSSTDAGDVVGFNFLGNNPLNPGTISYQMVINTTAVGFNPIGGTASIQDGGNAILAIPGVPEPATAAIAAVGLCVAALRPGRGRKTH